ncbi:MAG TPA: methionine synthase [Candidatus Ratteibacteria bacterium]|nr:methionine synthase [Candidatus Ratteibacteria bacterium]HRV05077.1 methionine synthase [Candidatus Ratteibacteria bacterium]
MKKILGAAIGNCIHVAGILNFLDLAKNEGFLPVFLGPAISVNDLVEFIKKENPDIIAIGYRLSENTCKKLLLNLRDILQKENILKKTYVFGGTPSTCKIAKEIGIFKKIFDGTQSISEIISFLRNSFYKEKTETIPPNNLIERIKYKEPFPLIRHHIGLTTVKETVKAVKEISKSKILDIVSIAPDQVAQESFFNPKKQKTEMTGAGGVPVREEEDFIKIYQATRCGNYPLLRCYSGTNDVFKWAEMLVKTINNAWCAVPIFWYNQMDKRGTRTLLQSIKESQLLMKWHAERNIPVEVNESHQWSLRRAPDSMAVAIAYLAAYNAKKMGVKCYISQYMLNTPAQISSVMDLAKMLAKIELIEGLHDDIFQSYRQVRPGLLSFPVDLDAAKGQLCFSIISGLMLKPHIVHVVSYCEGQYAAGSKEIIESCKMVEHLIRKYLDDFPDTILLDKRIQQQKEKLENEAKIILEAIKKLGENYQDPLIEPNVLEKAVKIGILDAPDLMGNKFAKGQISTAIVNGSCVSIEPKSGKQLSEEERIKKIFLNLKWIKT